MKHAFLGSVTILALLVLGPAGPVRADDPVQALHAADRLSCAFLRGITAAFTSQGDVRMKPPLDPNTPGLAIDMVDRAKGRAVLEEDALETPGTVVATPTGLSILARDQDGSMTLVTVYGQYSGVSTDFLMVSSRHAGGLHPQLSQRYGLCRIVPRHQPASPAPAPAAPHK